MSGLIEKTSDADLRAKSPLIFDASMIGSLLIIIVIFSTARGSLNDKLVASNIDENVEVIEIPPTKQLTRPPPPARPQIPVEAEDDDEIDDITIDDTEVDLTEEIPDIDEEEEDEVIEFFAVQQKPRVLKKVAPKYPSLAQKAGIEARVVVDFIVNRQGIPESIKILKGHPMLNDAAIEAIKQYKFSPGMQRDKPVPVRWRIPISFKLRN